MENIPSLLSLSLSFCRLRFLSFSFFFTFYLLHNISLSPSLSLSLALSLWLFLNSFDDAAIQLLLCGVVSSITLPSPHAPSIKLKLVSLNRG